MKCLNCNKELPDDFLFCDECGTPVQQMPLPEPIMQDRVTTSTDPSMKAASSFPQNNTTQPEPDFQQDNNLQFNPNAPQLNNLQFDPNAPQANNLQFDPNAPQANNLQFNPNAPQLNNLQFDPNAPQANNLQFDPNAPQTNNLQFDPNAPQLNSMQFDPNAPQTNNLQFDPNAPQINSMQFDPNTPQTNNLQFDPNAPQANNLQFDPNVQIPPQGNTNNDMKPGIKLGTKGIIGIAVVTLCIIAAIVATTITLSNRKTTILLNDYVSVEYDGYDGYGSADVSLDWEGLGNKLGEILDDKDSRDLENLSEAWSFHNLIYSIQYNLDKSESLSNGDTITLTWSYDNEIAGKYKIEFEGNKQTFTVSDLKEVKEIDPFEDLEVTFSGTSPYATVSWDIISEDDIYDYVSIDASKDENLTNGETITITFETYDDDEYFLSKYGCKFSQTSKEYTCENVACYVMDAEDMAEDLLETMKKKAKATITNYKSSIRSEVTISNVKYVGYYFLTLKDTEDNDWEDTNKCYVIYSATVKSKHKDFKQSTVYFPVAYSNLVNNADGTSYVDTDDIFIQGSSGLEYGWWDEVSGYKKLYDLKKALVTNQETLYKAYASKELE